MEDNLIAREKEEKITFWACSGIIAILHYNYFIPNGFNFIVFIPFIFSIFTILFDFLSNFIYYTKVERDPNIETIGILWINWLKFISFIISLISFLIIYFTFVI